MSLLFFPDPLGLEALRGVRTLVDNRGMKSWAFLAAVLEETRERKKKKFETEGKNTGNEKKTNHRQTGTSTDRKTDRQKVLVAKRTSGLE